MAKFWKVLTCFLLIMSMLVGCKPTSNDNTPTEKTLQERLDYYKTLGTSPDDNYRTWYEILVYSFCDSNGDGVGDLQGVISKLDYLQDLGINGIWLMPIHPSTSYHKYNVDDYYAIDPEYGTMEDFDQLMEECDKRGIKVILDLVVNHSGDNNPWFMEAVEYIKCLDEGEKGNPEVCPYYEFYNFLLPEEVSGNGYSMVSGTNYYYECRFNYDMPDLNLDSQRLRAEIKEIMKFWLDKGVAGFRVDAAKEFYSNNVTKNVEFMKWLQEAATELKPDVYMVAEVWVMDTATIERYYESGFTSIFNYPFGSRSGKLPATVNNRGNANKAGAWAAELEKSNNNCSAANPNYIDAFFTSNHDCGRIYNFCGGDALRMKLASAWNLFAGGSAFVYYGEEIGMPGGGDDPDQRAPMYWNKDRAGEVTMPAPDCDLPAAGYPLGSVEEQIKDPNSLFSYYKECIAIRNALPVIARGKNTVEADLNKECISAVRKTWNDETCIILTNFHYEAGTVDLSGYSDWKLVATVSADGNPVAMEGTTLNMAAYGIAILVPNN